MNNSHLSQQNNQSTKPAKYYQQSQGYNQATIQPNMSRSLVSIQGSSYRNNLADRYVQQNQAPTNLVISVKQLTFEHKENANTLRMDQFAPSSPYSPMTPISPIFPFPKYVAWKSSLFKPKFPARALLNVYIPKILTTNLKEFREKFPDPGAFYYYLDISTALQINDKQLVIFKYDERGNNFSTNPQQIIFCNYDLHHSKTNLLLYGCITPNLEHDIKEDKWMWKLVSFMDASQIYSTYGIPISELPNSSRRQITFTQVFIREHALTMNMFKHYEEVVGITKWKDVKQIKSAKRGSRRQRNINPVQMVIKISPTRWIIECKQSWTEYPELIPIVINENQSNNNLHWIEWVKLVGIRLNGSNNKAYVGISFRYLKEINRWMITSICLDKGDLENKHRLVGLPKQEKEKYLSYLKHFTITGLQWI